MNRERTPRAKKGCKRCGSKNVAWHQSSSGKWYLIEVFNDQYGQPIANYRDFHSNYCGKPAEHDQLQSSLDADYAEDQREWERKLREKEDERIKHEAARLREFSELTPSARRAILAELRAKYERLAKENVSMDVMSERLRWEAECNAARYELDMLEDFNADLEEN